MGLTRTVMLSLLLLFIAGAIQAQEEETLLSGGLESGGYGAPVVKFTTVKGEFAVMVGGYGGWLINHSFMIGGGGFGLVTSHEVDPASWSFYGIPEAGRIEFGYGGGMLEFIFSPMAVIHSTVSLLIGGGSVSMRNSYVGLFDTMDGNEGVRDGVFVLEPSVNVELNVTSFFRVNAGASYRFVSGTSMFGLKNSDLSGGSINLALKFGKF